MELSVYPRFFWIFTHPVDSMEPAALYFGITLNGCAALFIKEARQPLCWAAIVVLTILNVGISITTFISDWRSNLVYLLPYLLSLCAACAQSTSAALAWIQRNKEVEHEKDEEEEIRRSVRHWGPVVTRKRAECIGKVILSGSRPFT